jgi:hypothetical protein
MELFLRIFYQDALKTLKWNVLTTYVPDPTIVFTYSPDSCYMNESGEVIRFNGDGYIGEYNREKNPGAFRIAIVGDSYIAGDLRKPYYTSVPNELSNLVTERCTGIEVLNCGIDGGDRGGYLNYKSILYKIIHYQPDLILMQWNMPLTTRNISRDSHYGYRVSFPLGNDSIRNYNKRMIDKFRPYVGVMDWFYNFYLFRACLRLDDLYKITPYYKFVGLYLKGQYSADPKTFRPVAFSMNESAKMIRELRDHLRERGISFFLFGIDSPESVINDARQYSLPFILVNANLDREQEDYFKNDGHPNRQGNQKIADELYRILTAHKLLPSTDSTELSLYPANKFAR